MCLYLKAMGDFLLVGDLVRSMTVLQLRDGALIEVARDFGCNAMRAIEILGDGSDFYLGADDAGNLIIDRRNADAATDEERNKLTQFGEFHLGDHVNVFRFGLLNGQPIGSEGGSIIPTIPLCGPGHASSNGNGGLNSTMNTTGTDTVSVSGVGSNLQSSAINARKCVLFGTVSGAVGSIFFIDEDTFRFFSYLEKAMRTVCSAVNVGALSHEEFRRFNNERRSAPCKNVVDGDLIEHFIDIPPMEVEQVVRQLNEDLTAWNLTKTTGKRVAASSSSTSTSSSAPSGSNSATSSAIGQLSASTSIFNSPQPVNWTVEEVLRRVEDMARLH
jgi:DNA damage-binding protein 1